MEGRPSRGRGGGWKRGGRAAHDSDSSGGEHRGRGGHHRGRGRRDQHRGRGRGGGSHAAHFHQRDEGAGGSCEEEDDRREVFSRRKLESNWDRYEESEKQEAEDAPAQRGTDYHVLLESAGDSFTQFRFSEEKDWELDSFTATQMSAVFLDLPALAQSLQQVPLHQRLNLEAELVQVSTPVELPTVTIAPKQEILKTFTVPSAALKGLSTNRANPAPGSPQQVSSEALGDDSDEELDQLLSLQKPAADSLDNQPAAEAAAEKACDESEEVKDDDVPPTKAASVRQEMTEDDLEDWLDSMIS